MSLMTIEHMIDWVEKNIKDNPTLEDMSKHVGYSSFYCSAKFHEHVGMTFKKYISMRRLSHATNDVKYTERKIVDIAMDYGFSSQEAFTRAFVQIHGDTPLRYRRNYPKDSLKSNIG